MATVGAVPVVAMRGLPALIGEPITPGMRIGLLGGSFNPAHEGHLHISLHALKRLRLDQVWWLVSPQNPLKSPTDMAAIEDRLASAKAMARHPALRVSNIEQALGTRYTAETLDRLRALGQGVRFVWLMGADNMVQLPKWHRWQQIMQIMPVCVLARPGDERLAPMGQAAKRFERYRLGAEDAGLLPDCAPPAWAYLPIPLHDASSTFIRQGTTKGPRP